MVVLNNFTPRRHVFSQGSELRLQSLWAQPLYCTAPALLIPSVAPDATHRNDSWAFVFPHWAIWPQTVALTDVSEREGTVTGS